MTGLVDVEDLAEVDVMRVTDFVEETEVVDSLHDVELFAEAVDVYTVVDPLVEVRVVV